MGFTRRRLEPRIGYAEKGLDQAVTNAKKAGGNEELLQTLLFIEEIILKGSILMSKEGEVLKGNDQQVNLIQLPEVRLSTLEGVVEGLRVLHAAAKQIADNNQAEQREAVDKAESEVRTGSKGGTSKSRKGNLKKA